LPSSPLALPRVAERNLQTKMRQSAQLGALPEIVAPENAEELFDPGTRKPFSGWAWRPGRV
jgi:hypothetical protein